MVRRKAIFKKAIARNLKAKKYENAKRRLGDAFQGISKRPGRIDLDPREWNGGFNQPPAQQLQPRPGMIDLDPREWNGGFDQPPTQQFEDLYKDRLKKQEFSKIRSLLQQRQFQKPQPGPGGGMIDPIISLDPREWNGEFNEQQPPGQQFEDIQRKREAMQNPSVDAMKNRLRSFFPPPSQTQLPDVGEQFAGMKDKFAGGLPSIPPRIDSGKFMQMRQQLQPSGDNGRGIQLDPREWGGNGGFNQMMPKMPNPPMKQQPAQMPGLKPPMPNPGLGGGMPPQGPKQMPMPNPRRGLIPRPQDPRYKLM